MAAMPVSDKKQKTTFALNETADLQKSMLEEKLEALLENVDGVGKVQVILMTDEKKDGQSFYNSGTIQVLKREGSEKNGRWILLGEAKEQVKQD